MARSGDIAGFELLDQVYLHPSDEAHRPGLGLQRSGRSHQEGPLVLCKPQCHEVAVTGEIGHEAVDQAEVGVGIGLSRGGDGFREQKAHSEHQLGAVIGGQVQ